MSRPGDIKYGKKIVGILNYLLINKHKHLFKIFKIIITYILNVMFISHTNIKKKTYSKS